MARRQNLEMKAIRLIRFCENHQSGVDTENGTAEIEDLFVDITGRNENARQAFSEAMHALYGTPTVQEAKRTRKRREPSGEIETNAAQV